MLTYFEEVQRGNLSEGVVRDGICSSRSGEKYFQGNMSRGKCPIPFKNSEPACVCTFVFICACCMCVAVATSWYTYLMVTACLFKVASAQEVY